MVKRVGDELPPTTSRHTYSHEQWEDFIKAPLLEMSELMSTLQEIRDSASEADLLSIRERIARIAMRFSKYIDEPHPEESYDLVRELHANVNHQIGNLLMAGQAVSRNYKRPSLTSKIHETITNISQRIHYLLLTDFNFARYNFAEARSYSESPDIWCKEVAQKLAAYKKEGLVCDLENLVSPTGLPYKVHAHPGIIALALQELIINAEKASSTEAHQSISVSLDQEGDSMIFRVIDKGRGMSDEEVYTMFKKGVSQTNSTGMGLWQVQYLASAFDVDIYCEKTALGKGTTMALSLPLFTE